MGLLDKRAVNYIIANRTGDINHVIDVEDDKTIVGNIEDSDYGQWFLYVERFYCYVLERRPCQFIVK